MLRHFASLATLAVLWFALGESLGIGEIIAAGCVVVITASAHQLLRRNTRDADAHVFAWGWRALRSWPRRIVADALVVMRAVPHARSRPGEFRTLAMPEGGARHAAWSVVGTSISPNTYVVSSDDERREVLVHELVRSSKPDDELLWWPQ